MSVSATDRLRRSSLYFVSLLGLIATWQIAATVAGDPALLPAPLPVLTATGGELIRGELLHHVGITLMRVLAAFVLAMSIGITVGVLMGRDRTVDGLLDPVLIVLLNLPALVVIVLAYLWIGLTEAAAIAAVTINKVPLVTVMLREGARALDPQFDALASIYRMSRWKRLRHILLPQLAPYIAAAARSGIALIWKIVLVVELLGRSNGVGFKIHLYFQLFDVKMVLVYAISFVLVMLCVEAFVMRPVETAANRWRSA
ncbi:ABC transporter permease [Notoacmeibacter marinus]|uniref:ABC transporter permease n=1 Tax=Notoacmeibacter marinus TaxID=1876515 RepID=UPI000DF42790|nr:ABC transporter permease [Notoacmeibacter marinus]